MEGGGANDGWIKTMNRSALWGTLHYSAVQDETASEVGSIRTRTHTKVLTRLAVIFNYM